MKLFYIAILSMLITGCSLIPKSPVNLEKQGLIKVQVGSIIYGVDGKNVYSAFSSREQAVEPGTREIFVTREGDIRYNRGWYKIDVLPGHIYQISQDRRHLTVSHNGQIVDTLYLSPEDESTFLSKTEYEKIWGKNQAELQRRLNEQNNLAIQREQERAAQRHRLRIVGTKICKSIDNQNISNIIISSRDMGNIIYVGYVERVEKENIQIRIVNRYMEKLPNFSFGNFQPSIIWDDPKNWDIC